jgi:diguanylate cyclase (GGDEF)-like protein/PAS domain S-box-containing protein
MRTVGIATTVLCGAAREGSPLATMGRDPRQEVELRRAAELAVTVFGSLSETTVLVFDRELRCIRIRGGAVEAHGYRAEAIEGRLLADFVGASEFERLAPHYRAALDGELRRFEHRPADGSRVYDIDVAPIEEDGEIVGGLSVGRDITERKQIERALAHSAREYRDLAEQASDVVTRSDDRAVYTYVSPASARVYGFPPEDMVGRPVYDFVHPDDCAGHVALREALADGSEEEVAERRMKTASGDWLWVETRCRALRDDDGHFVGVQSSARDITDRKVADEQFRTAFDDALVGIALVAPDGSWLRVNESLCEIVGRTRDELYGMTFQDITHPEDLDADMAQLEQTLAGARAGYQMEKRYLRPDGSVVWALLSVSLVRDAGGEPLHFISQVLDISERKRLEAELSRMATRDDLTGLYNRRFFERELTQQLRLLKRHGGTASVLFLDLDRFKEVNDTLGHQSGDDLLEHVAGILTGRLRQSDVIARLGGDEFAVLLPMTDAEGAACIVAALEREFEQRPADLEGHAVTARPSIGVAELEPELDVDDVLRRADQAMYAIKRARRAT